MPVSKLELMHDHVRAIHRGIAGGDPPEPGAAPADSKLTFEEVARRFAELEEIARSIASVAQRVPPFSFAPPVDVIGTEREIVIEVGVPGVERGDADAQLEGDHVIVFGARAPSATFDGRVYFHAEMPRGPFRRVIRLPEPTTGGTPRVEVENGIVRVRLAKVQKSRMPSA